MKKSTGKFRLVVKVGLIGIILSTGCAMFGQNSLVNLSELHKKDRLFCLVEEPYTGTAAEYYNNGQIAVSKEFANGRLNGKTVEWYADGQAKLKVQLRDDVLIGDYNTWYPDGQKHLSLTYVNGTLDGVNTVWHENGHKKAEGNFLNGIKDGLFEKWDSNGEIIDSTVYVAENVG